MRLMESPPRRNPGSTRNSAPSLRQRSPTATSSTPASAASVPTSNARMRRATRPAVAWERRKGEGGGPPAGANPPRRGEVGRDDPAEHPLPEPGQSEPEDRPGGG